MQRINLLFERAKESYQNGDPGHDVAHIQRVMGNCKWLASMEHANEEIVLAAAILHDVVNLPKNHPERLQASQMAAAKAKDLLIATGFSAEEIGKITTAIEEHSYSLGRRPSSIESAILQDSDKLDALGAVGIMRAVTCGSRLGSIYYDVNDPFAEKRDLNDKSFTIDHFFAKLLKLPDLMNTEAAKSEALRRVKFMNEFLEQFKAEIGLHNPSWTPNA